MDIWVVLVEDRHSDVEALPFSTEAAAFAEARDRVPDDAVEEPLTPGMVKGGWVLYLPYLLPQRRARWPGLEESRFSEMFAKAMAYSRTEGDSTDAPA